ncbi:hypothetical protein HOO54_23670 [Bacillus sp. WMMC1349]|uniref:hypothetical protein n=1 Tax=Bacillus sp. WMMC1349 TaxID=2736254 RepID=UPI00155256EA|nr:hypothetical protein [Bacillus sp. WMMC1349]NPC91007.1 hypothetical protein [Bacillus sp. WMMC1349]NPC91052.1 hypothetical protein [Bacillus sp. WMMC1349]NPC94991.1 hypothetical protein [Bacillus sp. WMMC1349]NPC95021.1 hypothetical protein [Bacillus sp. WMMC1349]NPC95055.1 hypothetical protein [Bacillus sp. WMMC1349]
MDFKKDLANMSISDLLERVVNGPYQPYQSITTKEKMAPPLLQIELDDIDSPPRIFYNGKKIDKIINADFSYLTRDDSTLNPTHIDIEFVDKDSKYGTKAIVYNRSLYNRRKDNNAT